MINMFLLTLVGLPALGCRVVEPTDTDDSAARSEGTEPGDCTDRADNDGDGRFDCDDEGCAGSPDCDTGGDADTDTDTDTDSDADTDADTDSDTDTDSDSGGSWTVCNDGTAPYADLQDAIDDAADGDTVTVCAGTWDYIVISRATLSIAGEDAATTTILGGPTDPAVTLDDSDVELSGVTLTGTGSSAGTFPVMLMSGGSLDAHDLRIADTTSTASVIALELISADTSWDNVTVEDNAVSDRLIEAYSGGSFTMRHSVFRNNTDGGSGGPALLNLAGVDTELSNNLFHDNDGSDLVILSSDSSYSVWAYNNVFYGNSGSNMLELYEGSDVENNILYDNTGNGIDGSCSDANYNDSFDNSGVDIGHAISGTGNISEDPKFNDAAAGDFTLDPGFSPCVDAGNPLAGYNDVDGTRNDLGAYGGPAGSW